MRAKSLKSSQILRAHMPYFRRPSHIWWNIHAGSHRNPALAEDCGVFVVECISCAQFVTHSLRFPCKTHYTWCVWCFSIANIPQFSVSEVTVMKNAVLQWSKKHRFSTLDCLAMGYWWFFNYRDQNIVKSTQARARVEKSPEVADYQSHFTWIYF